MILDNIVLTDIYDISDMSWRVIEYSDVCIIHWNEAYSDMTLCLASMTIFHY